MTSTCTIDGCEGRVVARGYCRKHYTRWNRYGDPLSLVQPRRLLAPDERFLSYVDVRGQDDCWPWTGHVSPRGYGRCRHPSGRLAPRVAFFIANGYLPETVDHECHNRDRACPGGDGDPHRLCCNPAHLSDKSRPANHADAKRTRQFCRNGHEVVDDGARYGNFRCRECYDAARRRSQERVNAKRNTGVGRGRKKVDECPNGHRVADGAFYVNPKTGQRTCRICKNDRERARKAAKRAAE